MLTYKDHRRSGIYKITNQINEIFTSPKGEKILFESINSECKIRELHVSAMCEVARGVRNQYKGWTR